MERGLVGAWWPWLLTIKDVMLSRKAAVLPDAISAPGCGVGCRARRHRQPVFSTTHPTPKGQIVRFQKFTRAQKGLKALMVPLKIQLANELFCANGINIRYTCLAHLQAFFLTSFTQLVFLCLI